jgi:hypothetical protein
MLRQYSLRPRIQHHIARITPPVSSYAIASMGALCGKLTDALMEKSQKRIYDERSNAS